MRISLPTATTTVGLDLLGVAAAAACAVHCVALPVLLVLVPALGAVRDGAVEWSLFALSVAIGALSLTTAWRRTHRDARPMALLALGLLLLGAGRPLVPEPEWLEAMVTVTGAGTVAAAHLLNRALVRRARGA